MRKVAPDPNLLNTIQRELESFPLYAFAFKQSAMLAHTHTFIELVLVRKGHGMHLHAGKRYPIHAGDCFIILPGEEHGYDNEENLEIVNILFNPETFAGHIDDLVALRGFQQFLTMEPFFRSETSFKHKLHLDTKQRQAFTRLLDQLLREQEGGLSGSELARRGLFLQMFVNLSRAFGENTKQDGVREEFAAKEDVVAKAVAYLEERYNTKLTVPQVATHVCLSVSHLSHVFKEKTGIPLVDYLLRIRVDRAAEQLKSTDASITDISFEVGFHDPSYFSRAFKKHFGMTPAAYRKS